MINLFKKTRKKLVAEKPSISRTSNYLKYAIGEIVLVMVGILLALQVNTWNENAKSKKVELYILNEVLSNLVEDAKIINEITTQRKKAQKSTLDMIGYLPNKITDEEQFSTDFANFFSFDRYYPISNAYEMLKSNGLILSNNKLTTQLSRYYEFEQNKVNSSVKDIEEAFILIVKSERSIHRFITFMKMRVKVTVRNSNDPIFKKELMQNLIVFRDNNGGTLEKLLAFTNINSVLITALETEIKTLKK